MELKKFDYNLPPSRIAQVPTKPRDHSRLFVYDRATKKTIHNFFYNLPTYVTKNDVLVFNNTKVFPARLIGKKESGGKIEIFLLKQINKNIWEVLVGGRRKHIGTNIFISKKFWCTITQQIDHQTWQVKFNLNSEKLWEAIYKYGHTPTPPYIKKHSNLMDYQTVFAKKTGSVAAPTAGFHFTKKLIKQIKKQGIQIEYITLHVGLGTFAPVTTNDITKHKLHQEWVEIDKATANRINLAKKSGKRIIAVGTTSVRTLEALAERKKNTYTIKPTKKWVNIFIYPGYKFKFVDAIITNFHLPKSSLLMLVAALLTFGKNKYSGITILQKLYATAIRKKYRFYSFGDGMLIK
jgi:S-adenosylmethionine:tRNA ribosyltransferase-isomerase